VLKEGETATQEEIVAFCRERLAAYKVPRIVEFRDDLPKSIIGKVLRRTLREEEVRRAGE
jgi:long-chain acyl-CoA synthetase